VAVRRQRCTSENPAGSGYRDASSVAHILVKASLLLLCAAAAANVEERHGDHYGDDDENNVEHGIPFSEDGLSFWI
jgi:hypothetical protein